MASSSECQDYSSSPIPKFDKKGNRDTSLDRDLFYDAEGYIVSFRQDQEAAYTSFFRRYGFVVVECLPPDECERTIDDIWRYVETKAWLHPASLRKPPFPARGDPATWSQGWPGMAGEGILGSSVVFTEQALRNRQHPNLYRVMRQLYGDEKLLINMDRYGLFRPTEGFRPEQATETGEKVPYKKIWKTQENIHLDMCTEEYFFSADAEEAKKALESLRYRNEQDFIHENNVLGVEADGELHIQGLFNLADNRLSDGGFQLVPAFHHYLPSFARVHFKRLVHGFGLNAFQMLPHGLMQSLHPLRITMRQGCVVLWNQLVAHGSKPNASDRPRYAQFFKVFPEKYVTTEERRAARRAAIMEELETVGFQPSELGEHLFGLKPWE